MTDTVKIAASIDHTLLRANATAAEIEALCDQALAFGFASVCVLPSRVAQCARRLAGTEVAVCTVIGFPLGGTSTEAKVVEALTALRDGAQEIDIVVNQGRVKDGDWDGVREDLAAVIGAFQQDGGQDHLTKVIFETCNLTDVEKRRLCAVCVEVRADFVKTSTGFAQGGATVEDVAFMAQCVSGRCQVKASGGVRTLGDAQAMLAAGAARLGTSHGIGIVSGLTEAPTAAIY